MSDSKSFELAKQFLGKNIEVVIDRPFGSSHPKHGFVYEVNYGFVPGVKAPDGEDLDAYYLGVSEPVDRTMGKCIAIVHRFKDDDDKLVVAPSEMTFTKDEVESLIDFQEKWFEHEIVMA